MLLLIGLAWLWGEAMLTPSQLAWSAAAGVAGLVGLAALYRGLAIGRASLIAPLSSVIAAACPAVFSALTQGTPGPWRLTGFGLAVVAIWLVSQSNEQSDSQSDGRTGWPLAVLAGFGFGGFFILISLAGTGAGSNATFWPLAIARAVALPLLLLAIRQQQISILPPRNVWPLAVGSGLLDVGGNAFFLLAAQRGRLDVATVLSSLYPASTVILSWLLLGERITRIQVLGIGVALVAIGLIAR